MNLFGSCVESWLTKLHIIFDMAIALCDLSLIQVSSPFLMKRHDKVTLCHFQQNRGKRSDCFPRVSSHCLLIDLLFFIRDTPHFHISLLSVSPDLSGGFTVISRYKVRVLMALDQVGVSGGIFTFECPHSIWVEIVWASLKCQRNR